MELEMCVIGSLLMILSITIHKHTSRYLLKKIYITQLYFVTPRNRNCDLWKLHI